MTSNYTLSDVIKYLVYKHGGEIKGVKRLMHLLFLVQYCDCLGNTILKLECDGVPATKATFYIWDHGPMSNEVYDALDALEVDDVELPTVIRLPRNIKIEDLERRLPAPLRERMDSVVKRFKDVPDEELEDHVLHMLGIGRKNIDELRGTIIDDHIIETQEIVLILDVCK